MASVTPAEVAPIITIGAFRKPLPWPLDDAKALVHSMLDMTVEVNPSLLDAPPLIETNFGRLPVSPKERQALVERLSADPNGNNGNNRKLIAAAALYGGHFTLIHDTYADRLKDIWKALRAAERAAAECLSVYLVANLTQARDARHRYLDGDTDQALPSNRDVQSLVQSIEKIANAHKQWEIDQLKKELVVQQVVTLAATAAAVLTDKGPSPLQLTRATWDEINAADADLDQKSLQVAQATYGYLATLRAEAKQHPIVLVLQHQDLSSVTYHQLGHAIDVAVKEAEQATARIRAVGVNTPTFPRRYRPDDTKCSGLAASMNKSDLLSVWKIPFFVERALLAIPPRQAIDVRAMMELAASHDVGGAIATSLALFGVDTACMFLPAAGPVGVAIALMVAVFHLSDSVHEYRSLHALYHASLDPSLLLREAEHDEPSRLSVVLDLLGLLVW